MSLLVGSTTAEKMDSFQWSVRAQPENNRETTKTPICKHIFESFFCLNEHLIYPDSTEMQIHIYEIVSVILNVMFFMLIQNINGPKFRKLIRKRFFLTIPDLNQLILTSLWTGQGGWMTRGVPLFLKTRLLLKVKKWFSSRLRLLTYRQLG